MTTNRFYTTVRDYAQYVVEPALGEQVTSHNVYGIARECLTWDESAQEYRESVTEDEFWAIVEKFAYSDSFKECSISIHDKTGGGDYWTALASVEKGGDTIARYRIVHGFTKGVQTVVVKNLTRRSGYFVVIDHNEARIDVATVLNMVRGAIREGKL